MTSFPKGEGVESGKLSRTKRKCKRITVSEKFRAGSNFNVRKIIKREMRGKVLIHVTVIFYMYLDKMLFERKKIMEIVETGVRHEDN